MVRLGNNEVLKTLTKTLTFVDTDTNAGGSTTALRERCSGELKMTIHLWSFFNIIYTFLDPSLNRVISKMVL